ncbi:MAG TPA: hypothetical protein VL404_00485 [Candidatus Eisenbacteria bacterium]|jgi:hypothetical protein|nr:hypothetical protein [Candidatus Eisenbacteria bacterium]
MSGDHWTIAEILEESTVTRQFMRERLAFPRGILKLLKDTEFCGPLVEKALEDIDAIAERFGLEPESTGERGAEV